MANKPLLEPESQFPIQAIEESKQDFPKANESSGTMLLTLNIASAADMITPWGWNTARRDQELREFWPTESNLAGAVANVCLRNAAYRWRIKHTSSRIEQVVTDMLTSAIGPSGQIGWTSFESAGSQDYYTTDNGRFVELIRDPSLDASSVFKGPNAPVIGISHLDSGMCLRTGDPEFPVVYTDRKGKSHKLAWYEVMPMSEMPSPIARMNGVQVCAVSRVLRSAQIVKSVAILMDEMISGRNPKKINIVGGVSRTDIEDAKLRTKEQADNRGNIRFIEHVILASLDPEKPVSVAEVNLAEFPPDFDFDVWMRWYIATLALCFANDYQEFAPLPGGNIGSSSQSEVLNQKSNAKGPATYMRSITEGFRNYGVLPRGAIMEYEDVNQIEELEKQTIRTKAQEEAALEARNGILPPKSIRADLVRRGIYARETVEGIADDYGDDIVAPKQNIGSTGGNTMTDDSSRTPTGAQSPNKSNRLQKMMAALRGE